jgi:ketopantoate hydroxymethyltransferase
MAQKAMKYIDHLDLALDKVLTKALYKLQVSIAQEIQSRAHADAMELELAKDIRDTMKITIHEIQVKQHIGLIEQCVEEVFNSIPANAEEGEHLQT